MLNIQLERGGGINIVVDGLLVRPLADAHQLQYYKINLVVLKLIAESYPYGKI